MITKYEASATFVEGNAGGGTTVSFYGDDEKGRLLRMNVSIETIKALADAYDACQSTGHAAWHVENKYPSPCSQCASCKADVEAQREWYKKMSEIEKKLDKELG